MKISKTQCYLTVLYVCALLISNVIATRTMVLPFGLSMTTAVILFPITYSLSDIFSEVYGYKWSRVVAWLGFFMNLLMILTFTIAISTQVPDYFESAEAYSIVLGSTPKAVFASLLGYTVGEWVDDLVFEKLRNRTGFKTRAIISSVCGELLDSGIFITLTFFRVMSASELVSMMILQVILKCVYETIFLPLSGASVSRIRKAEVQNEG